jgi:cyclin B
MFSAKPYMDRQKFITNRMRRTVIDWIIELQLIFNYQAESLWLCINIFDRFLEKRQILKSKIQLLGVTSLLIACKFVENREICLTAYNCIEVTAFGYTIIDLIQLEYSILSTLDFRLNVPTGYHFLIRYLNCIEASYQTVHLANYYAERNLMEADTLEVVPHKFAAACVYAALKQQNYDFFWHSNARIWNRHLQEESGLSENDLKDCARTIIRNVEEIHVTNFKRSLEAVRNKFSTAKYFFVSFLSLPHSF